MKGTTHVKIGLAATLATATLVNTGTISLPFTLDTTTFTLTALGSVIGSLLPDDDTKNTTISKFMPISNKIITELAEKGVKACYHRHLFHSLLCIPLIAGYLMMQSSMILVQTLLFGIIIGSVCHILGDALLSNTWILYPIVKKPVSLLHLKMTDNEKLYKRVEKVCSALATISLFVLSGNLIVHSI